MAEFIPNERLFGGSTRVPRVAVMFLDAPGIIGFLRSYNTIRKTDETIDSSLLRLASFACLYHKGKRGDYSSTYFLLLNDVANLWRNKSIDTVLAIGILIYYLEYINIWFY
jgi:hypothetical protein